MTGRPQGGGAPLHGSSTPTPDSSNIPGLRDTEVHLVAHDTGERYFIVTNLAQRKMIVTDYAGARALLAELQWCITKHEEVTP